MDWKPTRKNIIFVIKQDSHENDFSDRYRWNSRKLLKYMLIAMSISFRFYPIEEREFAFEQGVSASEIKEAMDNYFGIWKNRTNFTDFQDFMKQVWKVTN